MTIDNRERSTKLAKEALGRPKAIADEVFDNLDLDADRALGNITAWVEFIKRLRITPMNSGTVWPPCIPQDGMVESDGLILVERQVATRELVKVTNSVYALIHRSDKRIRREVVYEVKKQTAPE